MKLEEFLEQAVKDSPVKMFQVATKLVDLESIEKYFNLVYGIEFDIEVRQVQPKPGRWYGKGVIEHLF